MINRLGYCLTSSMDMLLLCLAKLWPCATLRRNRRMIVLIGGSFALALAALAPRAGSRQLSLECRRAFRLVRAMRWLLSFCLRGRLLLLSPGIVYCGRSGNRQWRALIRGLVFLVPRLCLR